MLYIYAMHSAVKYAAVFFSASFLGQMCNLVSLLPVSTEDLVLSSGHPIAAPALVATLAIGARALQAVKEQVSLLMT